MSAKQIRFEKKELPHVWNDSYENLISEKFRMEAEKRFRQFSLPSECGEWKKTAKVLRERIALAMRLKINHKLPLDYKEYGTINLNDYSIKKISYVAVPGRVVTGNLYIPNGKGPFPAVINMHGHWTQGRLAERVQTRGHILALSGYVCLCVDAFGSGERGTIHGEFEYHGALLGGTLENIGETLMGIQVADNMRGVDLLSSLKYVDSKCIGATGASGGGNQTMWLASMDERIKAAVPVVSVGSFASYTNNVNCICELLPDGLDFTEESGVLALVAPRALLICNALKDSNPAFHVTEMLRSYKETEKVFKSYDAGKNLNYIAFNKPHGYWPEVCEAMLGFFNLHLRGIGDGRPCATPEYSALKEDELMLFPKGERPSEITGIMEYCKVKGAELRKSLFNRKKINVLEARLELASILKFNGMLPLLKISSNGKSGIWEKYSIETEDRRLIPVLVREPGKKSKTFRIISSARGKHELRETQLLANALDSNDGVILFDLFAAGENNNNPSGALPIYHDISRGIQWLGGRMMGEWVRDYLLMKDFAKHYFKAGKIIFGGNLDAAVATLFASVLSSEIDDIELENMLPTLQLQEHFSGRTHLTMSMLIPDILLWGDLPLAMALSCAKKKAIINMTHSDGAPAKKDMISQFWEDTDQLVKKLE